MLERTAATIEPSSLQRVLPSTRLRLHSRRQLHTAFWHHGAADLELIDACQALMRQPPLETKTAAMPAKSNKTTDTTTAPAVLLDFLYPGGIAALFRRPYLVHSLRLEAASRPRLLMSRLFTSSAPGRSAEPLPSQEESPDEVGNGVSGEVVGEVVGDRESLAVQGSIPYELISQVYQEPECGYEEALRRLLNSDNRAGADDYDRIFWYYKNLDPQAKHGFTTPVLLALSASSRPVEAWRVNDLFSLYQVNEWTEEVVCAVINAQLTLENVPAAMSIFRSALEERGFTRGLDYLAAYGLDNSAWGMVLESLELYSNVRQDTDLAAGSSLVQETEAFTDSRVAQNSGSIESTETGGAAESVDGSAAAHDASSAVGLEPEQSWETYPTSESADGPAAERKVGTFPTVARVTDFAVKVSQLYKSFEDDPESMHHRTGLVDAFLANIARNSLDLFRPSDAVFILDRVGDKRSYESYILSNLERGRRRIVTDLYWKYRALPGIRVAQFVLRAMIDVFHPHNVRGMEQVLADWYQVYDRLDERTYRKFMTFYSGRGDVKSVMRLAEEYAKHHNRQVEQDPELVVTVMKAYAVKGDCEAVRRVMEEAVEKTGVPPDTVMWNVLLDAHKRVNDYEGALKIFFNVCENYEPDLTTFGTIMGMAARRGDLEFTLEIFQLAQERQLQPNLNLIQALVEAYCQNDRYAEAEKLCVDVTENREVPGDYTLLWNKLLEHHAKRRNLMGVNRLLGIMSAKGIIYNQDTYSHLLLALLYCRQAQHAMHLLRLAHREGVFNPTPDHFILLMAAFMKAGEPDMVLKTNQLMAQMAFPESAARLRNVIDALGRWQELPPHHRQGLDGQHFLKLVLKYFYRAMDRVDEGAPDSEGSIISLYSKVLFILTQMREHATVEQLIELYNSRFPQRSSPQAIPIKLLHNIMLADFYEEKYDRVKETWKVVVQRTTRRYAVASALRNGDLEEASKPVAYAMRFRLSDPLKTMQRLYVAEGDAQGLMDTVAEIRNLGFELDSKNWNYYVQALAKLKEWRQAFEACEQVLMPHWNGWAMVRRWKRTGKYQLPLELRRSEDPSRPRPISHTLMVLAKEYRDLDQIRLWSQAAASEIHYIEENCPKTVLAITTMRATGSPVEVAILG
ncbi:hypothetical protein N656DRAFT_682301, partial [Canariomyces notabilis]